MDKNSKNGQGLIEYLLIIVLITMVGFLSLKISGVNTSGVFDKISSSLFGEQSKTIISDAFDNLNNWKSIFGSNNWKIVDGRLVSTGGGDKRIMLNSDLPDDYVVSAKGILVKGDGYGVMFRLTPQGNNYGGYCFQLDPGYGNKFVLRKYASNGAEISKPIAVANPPAGFDFKAPHDVQVKVVGNTYTAYIDGVEVMTATDSTYSSGGTGLRTWDSSSIAVDSFTVSNP